MPRVSKFLAHAAAFALFQIAATPIAFAAPILGGNLATFAVLGAAGVTSVGTTIGGNVGSFPTASTTGVYSFTFGGCDSCSGAPPIAGGVTAQQAQADLTAAIGVINSGAADYTPVAGVLAGVLGAGTYDVAHATIANISGALVLDGGGAINPVWRFRFTSDFVAAEGSTVSVINVGGDGSGAGIYWAAVSSATLNGNTMVGSVFANAAITTNGGLTISCGRLASADASVTLDGGGNSISIGSCPSGGYDQGNTAGGGTGWNGGGGNGGGVTPVPEPGTLALLGTGIVAVVARRLRKA